MEHACQTNDKVVVTWIKLLTIGFTHSHQIYPSREEVSIRCHEIRTHSGELVRTHQLTSVTLQALPKRAKRDRRSEQLTDPLTDFLEVWVASTLAKSLADRAGRLANFRRGEGTRTSDIRPLRSSFFKAGRTGPRRTNQTAQELLHHFPDLKGTPYYRLGAVAAGGGVIGIAIAAAAT